ncbi:MAG: aminotransferase class V-fold PLP-dependent enzyme [Acidobacteriota bacterium]|nr:aminotransferase class V-fold PLP-dependent enzyme [Acidobacteriota bacterium]
MSSPDPELAGSELAGNWTLQPGLSFLNHGSFGACPRPVLDLQQQLRAELEEQPVEFFVRRLPDRLDAARERLADFLGADPEDLVVVPNATAGVNTVLRSLLAASASEPTWEAGDELLTTDHAYNACRNALEFVARGAGARVRVATVPFPLEDPQQVVDTVLGAVTERTRLVLLDHITSPTGLVFPLEQLVRALDARGIDTLVDGAHAPGMLDLDLDALGAAYYTGNCHKWPCAPKGAAFLHVRRDRQDGIEPLSISHGANVRRAGRSRFHDAFDWTGTDDPTAFLCVPKALETVAALVPGGWPEVRRRNRELALAARRHLCAALEVGEPSPESMIGSLAAVPLPDRPQEEASAGALYTSALQQKLLQEHHIEVPIVPWPAPPHRLVRISAQLYNTEEQYRHLARALVEELSEEAGSVEGR